MKYNSDVAILAATLAGNRLLQNFRSHKATILGKEVLSVENRSLSKEVTSSNDHEADQIIIDVISERCRDHNLLTEETGFIDRGSPYTWVIDPRRFTRHATVELTALKAVEDYQNEFRFHFPHEHRPAGRNAKTPPLPPVLAAEGAAFTVVNGWERVDYIKPLPEFHPTLTFNFDDTFDVVGAEVANVANNVGLAEVSGFNRIEITGKDRHAFLDRMICGNVTKRQGRVGLAYLLNDQGCIKAEATIANLPASDRGPERVWYGSAAASEYHDMDWLTTQRRQNEDVHFRSFTNDQTILVLAGPKARAVLSACARGDWSVGAFPWLSVRECTVGFAPATVLGISFSGELAYEIHVPNSSLYAAYLALREAGEKYGLKLFGARAVDSMRMEMGFLHW